jgi:hypothetical protein
MVDSRDKIEAHFKEKDHLRAKVDLKTNKHSSARVHPSGALSIIKPHLRPRKKRNIPMEQGFHVALV